jgi:hypothetical protein
MAHSEISCRPLRCEKAMKQYKPWATKTSKNRLKFEFDQYPSILQLFRDYSSPALSEDTAQIE